MDSPSRVGGQGLHGSGSGIGLALLGNSKALQSQKRELQQMVKQLKTEAIGTDVPPFKGHLKAFSRPFWRPF